LGGLPPAGRTAPPGRWPWWSCQARAARPPGPPRPETRRWRWPPRRRAGPPGTLGSRPPRTRPAGRQSRPPASTPARPRRRRPRPWRPVPQAGPARRAAQGRHHGIVGARRLAAPSRRRAAGARGLGGHPGRHEETFTAIWMTPMTGLP
jgi:hypothetical protein